MKPPMWHAVRCSCSDKGMARPPLSDDQEEVERRLVSQVTAYSPNSDPLVEYQSSVPMHIRRRLCPAVGLTSFLETDFHATKFLAGPLLWRSGERFTRFPVFVSSAYYSPWYRPHCTDKSISAFRNKMPGRCLVSCGLGAYMIYA